MAIVKKKTIKKPDWWTGLKRLLSDLAFGVTGHRISIVDIEPSEGELGYTSKGNRIHIAYHHEMIEDLSETKRIAFIKGVFAHELGHKLITPFDLYEAMIGKIKNPLEKKIFATLFNITEDSALEYQLPCYVGGHLLNCLEFMIGHIYKKSPPINSESDGFQQYMRALHHYGDGGLVKGMITSPQARETFLKTTPIFDKIIEEPNGELRLIMTKDIFNLSRPLWEPLVKQAEKAKELKEALEKMMQDAAKDGKHESDSCMSGVSRDDSAAGSGNPKRGARRKITVKRISKEEAKAMGLDKSAKAVSDELPEGDITAYIVEDDDKATGDSKASKTSAAIEGDLDGSPRKRDASAESESASAKNKEGSSEKAGESSEASASASAAEVEEDYEGDGEISDEEYELSESDIAHINATLAAAEKEEAYEHRESELATAEDLEVKGLEHFYRGVSCKNYHVGITPNADYADLYQQLLVPIQAGVDLLHSQLKKIFRTKAEEKLHTRSGRLNIERAFGSRITVNMFDRRRIPSPQDIAVMLCIDESGSMRGNRSQCARQAAIGLAEVFGKLGIPLAVMGFTADEGYDVSHYHYLNWHNSSAERLRLLGISARSNNFDGYSIRYAAELLKRRKEKHKLLIIISDGQPACSYYRRGAAGISDTQSAIKNASKHVDIVGVAISSADTAVLHSMYQRYYVEVNRADQIFYRISAVIKDKIRKWD